MLDDHERRILAALERELGNRDAGAAHPRRDARFPGPPWWSVVCAVLGIAVAVFLVTLGLVGNAALLLAVAAAPSAPRVFRRLGSPM